MGEVDMLGKATEAVNRARMTRSTSEQIARAALEAAGVLGADAQPSPVHQDSEPSMHERAIEWAAETAPGRASVALCELLEQRKAFGLAKYGTMLQVSGPRDPLADLADELADALVYAQQGLERALADPDPHAGRIVLWRRRRDEIGGTLLLVMEMGAQRGG